MKKILSYNCHEALNTLIASLGYQVDLMFYNDSFFWRKDIRPMPSNVKVLPKGYAINPDDYFVMVLHNYWKQWEETEALSQYIPRVMMWARLEELTPEEIKYFSGQNVVFCSHSQKKKMGFEGIDLPIFWYGIDTRMFKGHFPAQTNGRILSCIHDFRSRRMISGFDWWESLRAVLPCDVYGYQEDGYQCPVTGSVNDLIRLYQEYAIYLDPFTDSPLSMSVLEAAACGMPIVSRSHDEWPILFKDGESMILSDNTEAIIDKIKMLLASRSARERIGSAARETILKNCSMDSWRENWHNYFKLKGIL